MPIDYSEYPANWKTEIRPAVMKRAGEVRDPETNEITQEARCEEEGCGVLNHSLIHRTGPGKADWEPWPEGMASEAATLDGKRCTKIILTVAHLDHDKTNHDVTVDRLKALCQKCHLRYDIKHHINNRKYGREHSKNNHKLDL
jgi:hypothetical protein